MTKEIIKVPDIGGAEDVDVIEVSVSVGDVIAEEDALIVLETDKATMDIPAPMAGKVVAIKVSTGDKVSEGSEIVELEIEGGSDSNGSDSKDSASSDGNVDSGAEESQESSQADEPKQASASSNDGGVSVEDIVIPDIGGSEGVDVIEVSVSEGDSIEEEDTLVVLESDKATMDIPSPKSGKIISLTVKTGDKLSEGDVIGKIEVQGSGGQAKQESASKSGGSGQATTSSTEAKPESKSAPSTSQDEKSTSQAKPQPAGAGGEVHAGPAVRKLARELGVDLTKVTPTGRRNRIQKDDLHNFVKEKMKQPDGGSGLAVADMPTIDFSKFGEVEYKDLNKIKRATAKNLHRSWVTVPHVTQFDDADITDLEKFRKNEAKALAPDGVKVTPLAFLLKASAAALKKFPQFNASLSPDGSQLIYKKYVHIGIAVETPDGLVVPVIKDVDKKGIFQLAEESAAIAKKARDKKLPLDAMQGGCFSISSLGGIGGTAFTPIVNAPEVAILGVSKSDMKPKWNGQEFEPRLMLPLSLSYDHRVIDGAEAARFTSYLSALLSDLRTLLL